MPARRIITKELERAIAWEIAKDGPTLLWSGEGKFPGAQHRGIRIWSLDGYLQSTLEYYRKSLAKRKKVTDAR